MSSTTSSGAVWSRTRRTSTPCATRCATGPITVYCGFDPTAPSLHMGNLLQLLTLKRLQDAGHTADRRRRRRDRHDRRPQGVRRAAGSTRSRPSAPGAEPCASQVSRFLDLRRGPRRPRRQQLRVDVVAVDRRVPARRREALPGEPNAGARRGPVAPREPASSYTEFSYVLLQSMDYLELFRRYGCHLQTGGADQWGNITAGVELIRRVEGARVHALRHAPRDEVRRHQVRQDRDRHRLARPRP